MDSTGPPSASRRVLIVEDNPDHVFMLQRTLAGKGGFEVVVARSAREGREAYDNEGPFDAIVSDQRLPDLEGMRFIRELRGKGFDGVILLVTAQATEETAAQGLEAGATDYVFKARGYADRVADELVERIGGAR